MANSRFLAAALTVATLAAPSGVAVTQPALAQEKPTSNAVASEIPTSAFSWRSAATGARLSPDGKRFAYAMLEGGDTFIVVFDADTQRSVIRINLGDRQDFNFVRWAGNDRLLFSMTGTHREMVHYSRLFYFDLKRDLLHPLVSDRMGFDGDNIVYIDPEGDYVLTSYGRSWREEPSVWRFDLTTDAQPEPQRIERRQNRVGGWIADNTGTVRIALAGSGRGRLQMRYRSDLQDDWETVARARIDDEDSRLDLWDFMGLRAGSDTGYSIGVPEGGERSVLMKFDFSTGQPGDIVSASPDEDVSSVFFDQDNNPIAVGYSGDSFRRKWLDPQIRALHEQVGDMLDGSRVRIQDIAADRSRALVVRTGPADPGALYVYTPSDNRLELFAEFRPQMRGYALSEPQPIRYNARDGTSIHAFLTLPTGRTAEGLPLIVYPHGGPFGIRDTDDYNDTVQLLANRGYAVIQPNFRGSGGYGEAFLNLGWGQIGRAMQDDLDDAVAYLVAQGTVDPSRVCMVGESYGGFASVWGVIRNPDIYRCAASWAGVMHFERQLNHDRNYLFGQNLSRWRDRVDGDRSDFDLDDVSPAVQVERLSRPVLLGHGELDNIVPFDQLRLMASRAENAGIEVETFTLPHSGHAFYSRRDEQAYYDALLDFLARHNPAD